MSKMSSSQNINIDIASIKNLPPLPETSVKIVTAINDPDISIEEIVKTLSLSPTLVARLLGLANSAYFGRSGQITDLRIAIIQILGLTLVKSLTLSIILNVELNTTKCKLFDASYFWNHSLVTALIAQKLATHIDDELMSPEIVYTSGLLLNIGLLAAVFLYPEKVNKVFAHSDRIKGGVSQQMQEIIGQTQYDIGGLLLEKWKLPVTFHTVVKKFRQKDFVGKEKQLIRLLELSHWVGYYIFLVDEIESPDFSGFLQELSLSKTQLDKVITETCDNKENLAELAQLIGG